MLPLYKITLGPLLLSQARRIRRTALRLPEPGGPREGVIPAAGDAKPIRLLFLGDSSAAGVGVDTQAQALASQAAAFLAARTGAAVEWQLIAKSGLNTRELIHYLETHVLKPADVVVTALGVNDVTSQRSARQFVSDYRELIDKVFHAVGARIAIVNGVPPMHILPAAPQPLRWYLGQCASRLDARLREWIATADHLKYVSLQWAARPKEMARDGYHPGLDQYRRWAEMVAESAAAGLAACR